MSRGLQDFNQFNALFFVQTDSDSGQVKFTRYVIMYLFIKYRKKCYSITVLEKTKYCLGLGKECKYFRRNAVSSIVQAI